MLAITDPHNMTPHKGLMPITVGMLITALALAFGYNCGCAMNPARDLSPRIFTALAGWGLEPFR